MRALVQAADPLVLALGVLAGAVAGRCLVRLVVTLRQQRRDTGDWVFFEEADAGDLPDPPELQ